MLRHLKGKIALITGASSGIGRACAELLAAEGMRVLAIARTKQRLAGLEKAFAERGYQLGTVALDVRDRKAVEAFGRALAEEFGQDPTACPAVLVNNAGLARGLDPIQSGSLDDWDEMIDTNVKGLLYMTRAVLPLMLRADFGHIINVGSVAGRMSYPKGNVYCATKSAVASITESTNLDLLGSRVRACCIEPGMVKTEFSLVRFHGDAGQADSVYDGVDYLTAEDIAETVRWVVGLPQRVNVQSMLVMPTQQRNPYVVDRRRK